MDTGLVELPSNCPCSLPHSQTLGSGSNFAGTDVTNPRKSMVGGARSARPLFGPRTAHQAGRRPIPRAASANGLSNPFLCAVALEQDDSASSPTRCRRRHTGAPTHNAWAGAPHVRDMSANAVARSRRHPSRARITEITENGCDPPAARRAQIEQKMCGR